MGPRGLRPCTFGIEFSQGLLLRVVMHLSFRSLPVICSVKKTHLGNDMRPFLDNNVYNNQIIQTKLTALPG